MKKGSAVETLQADDLDAHRRVVQETITTMATEASKKVRAKRYARMADLNSMSPEVAAQLAREIGTSILCPGGFKVGAIADTDTNRLVIRMSTVSDMVAEENIREAWFGLRKMRGEVHPNAVR